MSKASPGDDGGPPGPSRHRDHLLGPPAGQAWCGLWAAALGNTEDGGHGDTRTFWSWNQEQPSGLGGWLYLRQLLGCPQAAESHPHPPRVCKWCQGRGQLLQMSFYLFNLPYHRPSSQAPASGDSGLPGGKVSSGVASWQKECFGVGPAWVQIPAEAFRGEEGSALSPPGHGQ